MVTPLRVDPSLTEAQVRAALAMLPSHHHFGSVLEVHATLDSTNNVARALAEAGAPEGTTVVADHQTAGRGRQGRTWFSPPGTNLYLSVVLRPPLAPTRAPLLTLACAVAVVDGLRSVLGEAPGGGPGGAPVAPPLLKWPNDILLDGRKVCGILTEMTARAQSVDWVIVGIGVNVNLPEGALPAELRERATSLLLHTRRPFDRAELCAAILSNLERQSARLYVEGPAPILADWRRHAAHLGKPVRYRQRDALVEGVAVDVDESGGLIVALPDGTSTTLLSGEIELP